MLNPDKIFDRALTDSYMNPGRAARNSDGPYIISDTSPTATMMGTPRCS